MGQLIHGGGDAFNALLYGQHSSGTINYLQNQLTAGFDRLSEMGQSFMQQSQQLYERFNGSDAMLRARAALQSVRNTFRQDIIRPMQDYAEFQQAQPMMQRFVMANPMVRKLYHQQRVDGYSGVYEDAQPGVIGEGHFDYRQVMQGLVVDLPAEKPSDPEWCATFYFDDLPEGDRELELGEQVTILSAWSALERILQKGKHDPTSISGGFL